MKIENKAQANRQRLMAIAQVVIVVALIVAVAFQLVKYGLVLTNVIILVLLAVLLFFVVKNLFRTLNAIKNAKLTK